MGSLLRATQPITSDSAEVAEERQRANSLSSCESQIPLEGLKAAWGTIWELANGLKAFWGPLTDLESKIFLIRTNQPWGSAWL